MPLVYYRTNGSKKVSVCDTDIKKQPEFPQTVQLVEKVCFFKKCLFSIPIPFRTLCWLCFVQSLVCPYFGILAENPFPPERGYILGLPPLVPVGGFAPATPFSKNIGFSADCSVIYITFFLSRSISAFSSEIGSFSSPEMILAISLFLPSKSSFVMPV